MVETLNFRNLEVCVDQRWFNDPLYHCRWCTNLQVWTFWFKELQNALGIHQPNDIESNWGIEKMAAAASGFYGAQAANGVLSLYKTEVRKGKGQL